MIDITQFLPQPLVEMLGSVLLHFIWQGALVGIFLFLTLNLLQRHSAQVRSSAALLALVGILVSPLATTLWLVVSPPKAAVPTAPEPRLERIAQSSAPTLTTVAQREEITSPTPAREFVINSPSFPVKVSSAPLQTSGTIPLHEILPLLVALWLIGVITFSLRFIISWIITQQLRSQATTLAPQVLQRALRRLSKNLQVSKPIRLLESGIVNAPVVVGWLSPVILLPSKVVENFSLDKLEPILAHELAHIRRNDWFVIVFQRLAETLFFYHPVVWWLSRLLEKEREYSCDDVAAAICGNPKVYAQALAELEIIRSTEPQLVLAASSGPLLNRIRRLIMASSVKTHAQSSARAVAGSLVMATFLAVIMLGFGPKFAFSQVSYNEAPVLASRVAAGELPPVSERLPQNPLVIEPIERIGQYGGTWRRITTSPNFADVLLLMYGHSLLRWADDGQSIVLGLAEEVGSNEDLTVWTVRLREGVRWSDGQPVTVDDILFWWNDMVLNPQYPEPVPPWGTVGDELLVLEKVDDYTLRFVYPSPVPVFETYMALWVNGPDGDRLIVPSHYMKQFHPDHSDHANFDTFDQQTEWPNPDYPVLTAWRPVEYRSGDRLVLERNPYYYAVDPEGNQLPYIDQIQVRHAANLEVVKLEIINGNVDMQLRPYIGLDDVALLRQNEAQGDYRTLLWGSGSGTGVTYFPNVNHPDPEKAELYQNAKFKRALSHAINRDRINRLVYFGLGENTTGTFSPNTRDFHLSERGQEVYQAWRDSYVTHDPDRARELLDEVGVVDQTGDGWRNLPNGAPLTLRIDQSSAVGSEYINANQFLREDWEAVGLRTVVNPVDPSHLTVMRHNGEFDIHNSWEIGGVAEITSFPHWLIPINQDRWAPLYGRWYSLRGTPIEGADQDSAPHDRRPPWEEPPEDSVYMRLYALYEQALVEPDEIRRTHLMLDAIQLHIDEGPFIIGTAANYPRPLIAKNNFHNVPTAEQLALGGWVNPTNIPSPALTNPETYFFDPQ